MVWFLLGSTAIGRTATFMCIPFLALYLADLGFPAATIGLIVGVSWLAGSIGGLVGGYLADRWGPKNILLASLTVWSLSYFGFSWSEGYGLLIVVSMLNGLARAFYDTVSKSIMIGLVPKKEHPKILGRAYMALNLAAAVGPLAGAALTRASSYTVLFWIAGLVHLLLLITSIFVVTHFREDIQSPKAITLFDVFSAIFRDGTLMIFLLMGTIFDIGFSQLETTLPLFLDRLDMGIYPALLIVNAVLVILFSVPISDWTASQLEKDRMGTVMTWSTLIFSAGLTLFFGGPVWLFFVGISLISFGEMLFFPAWESFIAERGGEKLRSTYLGSTNLTVIGYFLGPLAGGWLLDESGGATLFPIMGVVSLTILVLFFFSFMRRKTVGMKEI